MKKTIIILLIFMLALFLGCVQNQKTNPTDTKPSNSCGNNVCELNEDCQSCVQDCGCKNNQYCETQTKVCKTPTCGNGLIEQGETQENCCSDAGCPNNLLCNEKTQNCIEKVNIEEQAIRQTIDNYIKENDLNATIDTIIDTYYNEQQAKKVTLNCHTGNGEYPCGVIIYIDKQGKIIETIITT